MDWKRFLDRLGLNGTWWQWRIHRWQERWASWRQGAGDARRTISYEHGFCRSCGAIVPRGEPACMRCGARAPSRAAEVARRTLGLVLPKWCPAGTLLIAANLLAMGLGMVVFGWRHVLNPDSIALVRLGALVPQMAFGGEVFRLITYGFLHIGILHLLFNLLALSQVGPLLEQQVGSARFYVVYTLAMIGGGLAGMAVRGPVLMVVAGASGALFGLIGFGLSYAHFYGGGRGIEQRNFFLQWALYGFAFGLIVRADNLAHLGGFLVGAILGFIVESENRRGWSLDSVWNALAAACAAATLASVAWVILAWRG